MENKKVIKEFSDEDFYQDDVVKASRGEVKSSKKDLRNTVDSIIGESDSALDSNEMESIEVTSISEAELKDYVERNLHRDVEDSQEEEVKQEEVSEEVESVDESTDESEENLKKEETSSIVELDDKSDETTNELEEKVVDEVEIEKKEKASLPEKVETVTPVVSTPVESKKGQNFNHSIYQKIFKDSYIEFTKLLIVDIVFFVCLLLFGGVLLFTSFSVNKEQIVSYQETSNLDYKIYLLPNDFYEEKYLGKDMIYVVSLIDHIDISFAYQFASNAKVDMDFSYRILADLEITNKEGARSFYKKQYVLLDSQNLNMQGNDHQNIVENVKIDYSHYNSLANKFKATYGLDTDSTLKVYMVVTKKNPAVSSYTLNEEKTTSVTIPLTQKAVDIQVPYNDINSKNTVLQSKHSVIRHPIIFILSLLFFMGAIYSLVLIVKKLMLIGPKRSAYDVYVNKILKEYDRLIVESDTLPPFDDKHIIKLRKFTELLDVHDNLQLPIIQYTITKHHKCYFYISHKDTIYLYVLKAVDLEADQNEKKAK